MIGFRSVCHGTVVCCALVSLCMCVRAIARHPLCCDSEIIALGRRQVYQSAFHWPAQKIENHNMQMPREVEGFCTSKHVAFTSRFWIECLDMFAWFSMVSIWRALSMHATYLRPGRPFPGLSLHISAVVKRRLKFLTCSVQFCRKFVRSFIFVYLGHQNEISNKSHKKSSAINSINRIVAGCRVEAHLKESSGNIPGFSDWKCHCPLLPRYPEISWSPD